MKKNKLIIATVVTFTAFNLMAQSKPQMASTPQESVTSKVIGKVLASIDYSRTSFDLNQFEGSFGTNDDKKTVLDIQALDASLDLKFKDSITMSADEFIKNLPQVPQVKQWVPYFTLNLKDYRVKAKVVTAPQNSKSMNMINVKVNFKKDIKNSVESDDALKIQVGNELNQNFINMNLIALNVNVSSSPTSAEMMVSGSCLIDKVNQQLKQRVDICEFNGKINPSNGTYQIKLKFKDKAGNSLQ
jgi:hypothetical protein